MIIFIENLAGIQIASHSTTLSGCWSLKFVSDSIAPWISNDLRANGPIIILRPSTIRWLKLLFGVLQLPIIQQDPTCFAFKLNIWRCVMSDGMLTEYLVDVLGIKVRKIHSILSAVNGRAPVIPGCAIIGSNWMEFGAMSESAYVDHLRFLNQLYPSGIYYCHPKERSHYPEQFFGVERVVRPTEPVESFLRKSGVPKLLVGVCSTSIMSLAIGNQGDVVVDLVNLNTNSFDGPKSDTVEHMKKSIHGIRSISVDDIQSYLAKKLQAHNISVNIVVQPYQ